MSEPELAYMTGTNEDFDLPRWQTQAPHDHFSSSAQAAQAASQAPYIYNSGPPPPPPQALSGSAHRLPPINSASQQSSPTSTSGASRQLRISQLLEQEQPLSGNQQQYLPAAANQLARSASLSVGISPIRGRRHHQPDDLERAFASDSAGSTTGPRQQSQQAGSFYPSSVAYHQQQPLSASGADDAYQDLYSTSPGGTHPPPRRANTQHDSSRTGRSPLRSGNNAALLDPYSRQQSQYSPTTASYSYSSGTDISLPTPPTTSGYRSHSRSRSQGKPDGSTPPVSSPYTPQTTTSPMSGQYSHPSSIYSSSYSHPMDTTSSPQPQQHPSHLTSSQPAVRPASLSSPATPLSYSQNVQTPYYTPESQPMAVELPPQRRRASGLKRVRDSHDLRPFVNPTPAGRRMDETGAYLSPLKQLTTSITETYHICNPQFRYESTHNPRRVLTKPSKPAHNDGHDNEDYDYILYVNDWLGTEEGHKYLILDILGQGTFGQVVKCQNMKTHEIVAVKVVKNKPAYFNQSMMEVTILELLNTQCDPHDEHHILRMHDSFIHRNHLCLVFELLSSNLYELIKQNQFQGLSTQLVKVFTAQLLDAMSVLKDARLIHCDLKPENILLKSLQSPQIKVIDFGSACHERQTVYTYIQSRFYRSPEVLLGIPYTAAIDMWSLGCIAVELFLGLPLFPGTSEYNQITRIIEMLGMPPTYMTEIGKQSTQFFDSYMVYGQKKFRLKSIEQYSREHNTQEQPGKQYFKAGSLPEIINNAPMPTFKSSRQGHEMEKELNNRASFIDFCQGLLNLNPIERWSPQQARLHPFITGEKFTKPFVPPGHVSNQVTQHSSSSSSGAPDLKRPFGGLVPSQPKGTRAYQDAASYNQQLAQHQAYTAQAQAASQASNNTFRNPYITSQTSQQPSTAYTSPQEDANGAYASGQQQYASSSSANATHRGLTRQSSAGQLGAGASQYGTHSSSQGLSVPNHLNPNPPSTSYYPNARARANTINQMGNVPVNQMDTLPPALARLQHMNQDVIVGGRNALTPVLNREEAMREWERRQAGNHPAAQPYPQLEYLQQQAELAAASGMTSWNQPTSSTRFPPASSKLSHSYQPVIVVDEDRRDAVMSNVRSAARQDQPSSMFISSSNSIPSPPQAYTSNSTTTGNRFATTYPQQEPPSAFDSLDRRTDIGTMYVPMQPDQYQSYPGAGRMSPSHSQQPLSSTRHGVAPPPQTIAPSFYGAGVVPTGQPPAPRNPFSQGDVSSQGQMGSKDSRRHSGMDLWPR